MKRFAEKSAAIATVCAVVLLLASAQIFAQDSTESKKKKAEEYDAIAKSQEDDDKYDWINLFDGKSLQNWIDVQDGGEEAVEVRDGILVLGMGPTTTSIRFDEKSEIKLPRENYEVEYVAKRDQGMDFFAALTFPIGDDYVTFVNGGWGGCVAGISSIDEMDASENSTSSFFNFRTGVWYRFRVQVTLRTVRVWINDELTIDYVVEGHSLRTRFEVEKCKPLGFASWVSSGWIKTVRIRTLSDEEVETMNKRAEQHATFFHL